MPRIYFLFKTSFVSFLFLFNILGLLLTPRAKAEVTLLNVSYDPTREFYAQINTAFTAAWKETKKEEIVVHTSHGGSGAQARAVIEGLKADVVTLALALDIDAIAAQTGKIPKDWAQRFPNKSCPYTSTIVFLVRQGNPKAIKDWEDLIRSDVRVITPNPKTSGGARWNYLAAWGYAQTRFGNQEDKILNFMTELYRHVPVLDRGARGATLTFAQRKIGDVLIAWENEALLAQKEFPSEQLEIIYPSLSIQAEAPVALVEGNLQDPVRHEAAEAYLDFLYKPMGQTISAKSFLRPVFIKDIPAADLTWMHPLAHQLTIDQDFGGWNAAQLRHFAEGGTFDRIFEVKP